MLLEDTAQNVPTTLATPPNGMVMQILVQLNYCNTAVAMLLTHYNLLLIIKITPWISIICLLLVIVT